MGIKHLFDPGSPNPTVCATLDELHAVRSLAEVEGWEVLPRDCPERGTVGWNVVKDGLERVLEYALYGRRLEPAESVVEDVSTFKDLVAVHGGHDSFEYHSWPTTRQVGFVCCCESGSGVSRVVRVPFFRQERPRADKQLLLDINEESKKNRGPWFEREGLRSRLL